MVSQNKKFKKTLLVISAILGVILLVSGAVLLLRINTPTGSDNVEVEEPPRTPEEQRIIEQLPESDGYTLRRNPTEYQIGLFELLVNAHDQFYETESDEDLKNYASAIARNFVADFFTLSNKSSRTDVGGLQFFSEDLVDNFRNFAVDEFYLYLNQYIRIFGNESLPTVESTTILNVEFGTRIIEIEDENNADGEEDSFGYGYGYTYGNDLLEEEIRGEEIRTIIVDIEWSYASSTLQFINEFQTAARLILIEREEGVRIYIIEVPGSGYENYTEFYNEDYG